MFTFGKIKHLLKILAFSLIEERQNLPLQVTTLKGQGDLAFLFKLLLFFHVVYLLSFLQSNHKDNQMHNCEDGDENESVSLDAALSAASKNLGNLLKGIDNKTVRSKLNYTHARLSLPVFTPKMAIFRRAGISEGGLPLQLAFQYLILLI